MNKKTLILAIITLFAAYVPTRATIDNKNILEFVQKYPVYSLIIASFTGYSARRTIAEIITPFKYFLGNGSKDNKESYNKESYNKTRTNINRKLDSFVRPIQKIVSPLVLAFSVLNLAKDSDKLSPIDIIAKGFSNILLPGLFYYLGLCTIQGFQIKHSKNN